MKGLTQRQHEILNYINDYVNQHSHSPSYRDIMNNFKFSSLGSVYKHLKALQRKGALTSEEGCARSIYVTEEYSKYKHTDSEHGCSEIPFIGYISANEQIETVSSPTTIAVPNNVIKNLGPCYIFQIRGEGFIYDGINDGDLLAVESITRAHPGDIVLAVINKNETILKRYFPEGSYIRFETPSNNSHPITVKTDDTYIQGRVILLFRLYT